MLRVLSVALLLGSALAVWGQEPNPFKQVHLNAPGVLDDLRASNPSRYEAIQRHVDRMSDVCPGGCMLLTTYPPQRDVDIVLGDTRYKARVTLAPEGGRVYHTRR